MRLVLSALFFITACGSESTEIRVDLRTDYVPGGDFATVSVSIDGVEQRTEVGFDTDAFSGIRVARFDVTDGTHRIETRLLDAAGVEVDSRLTVAEARGPTAITVLMDRSCQALECEACVAGRCVDPSCSPETPELCEPECMVDSDCVAPVVCGSAACIAGVCLEMRDDSLCADAEWCSPDSGCVSRNVATLSPTFPNEGAHWNQYVTASGAPWESRDVACDPASARFDSCLHGGEHRTVTAEGVSTCAELEVRDALGMFEWECVPGDGRVQLHSTRLLPAARLTGLIDVDALRFRENWVEVTTAGARWSTAPSIWWKNPIRRLTELDGEVRTNELEILVVNGGAASSGMRIEADGVTLLVDGVLRASAASSSCLNGDERCLVEMSGDFNWVEGIFDADEVDGLGVALAIRDSRFARVRHVRGRNTWGPPSGAPPQTGVLHLLRAHASRIHQLTVHEAGHTGVRLDESHGNELAAGRISRTIIYGLFLTDSERNVVRDYHINAAGHESFWLAGGARDNTIVHSRVTGSEQGRHILLGETRNTMHRVLAASLRGDAFDVSTPDNTLSQIVAFDVTETGLEINDPTTRVTHYACLHCREAGVEVVDVGELEAHGEWLLGASTQPCGVTSSSPTPGLDAGCMPIDGSTARFTLDVPAGDDFGLRVVSDMTNEANVSTPFEALEPNHWSEFDGPERGWSIDVPPGDLGDDRRCEGTQLCRMWEWSLAEMSPLRNVLGDFAACSGGPLVTDRQDTPNTYLSSAEEIAFDFIGDDDGLCETGEHCVFTPHLGPVLVKPGAAVCETPEGVFLHEPLE